MTKTTMTTTRTTTRIVDDLLRCPRLVARALHAAQPLDLFEQIEG